MKWNGVLIVGILLVILLGFFVFAATTILQDANTENLKDSYVDNFCCPDRKNNNYGTSTALIVGGTSSTINAYITFNISEFSNPLTQVYDSFLYLYLSSASGPTGALANVTVQHVYLDWRNGTDGSTGNILNETELTYSNKPIGNYSYYNSSTLIRTQINESETGQWYKWNVTNYVKNESASGSKNITFVLSRVSGS